MGPMPGCDIRSGRTTAVRVTYGRTQALDLGSALAENPN